MDAKGTVGAVAKTRGAEPGGAAADPAEAKRAFARGLLDRLGTVWPSLPGDWAARIQAQIRPTALDGWRTIFSNTEGNRRYSLKIRDGVLRALVRVDTPGGPSRGGCPSA